MSVVSVPQDQWMDFLQSFSQRHQGWLVQLEIHDSKTDETVTSSLLPLRSIDLDLEDEKNPRINITVHADNKEIKHVLFRPSRLTLSTSNQGTEQALQIESLNTTSTVRFRVAAMPESVDAIS